jgi:hypothetical protein
MTPVCVPPPPPHNFLVHLRIFMKSGKSTARGGASKLRLVKKWRQARDVVTVLLVTRPSFNADFLIHGVDRGSQTQIVRGPNGLFWYLRRAAHNFKL